MSLNEILISTRRLTLRAIKLTDSASMLKYRSNQIVSQYQNWKPRLLEDVNDFISKLSDLPNIPDTWYQLGIFIKEKNELIGDIGIHFIDNSQVEIGFTLSLEYQGKGFASEAVVEVINYLFFNLKKHRLVASVDPRNIKSMTLLGKIGLRKEAHFRKSIWFNEQWADDVVFAILEEEWAMKIKPSLKEQLYQLEEQLLQPEVRKSTNNLEILLAEDFIEFGSSGRIFDKQQIVEGLPHSPTVRMTFKDFEVKALAPDVILTTFRVVKHNEPRSEMRYSLRSSIWKYIDGRWQMVFHQGTPTMEH